MSLNYTVVDTETSGATNGTYGNPFTDSNRLCFIGAYAGNSGDAFDYNLCNPNDPYGNVLERYQKEVASNIRLFVGFNVKFDLHWLRRYSVGVRADVDVWDCQLAEFIMSNQQETMPSLEDTLAKYGLGDKFVDIEKEYWDKGIDTPDIPADVTRRRVISDVQLTAKLFEMQIEKLKERPQMKKLIWLACQDLKVLAEMEWNGLKYDLDQSMEAGNDVLQAAEEIVYELNSIVDVPHINWGSGDHLSAVLYGGIVAYDGKEDYLFTYKDGRQVMKQRKRRFEIQMPRRVEPLPKSELKKEGYFSTDASTLKKLKTKDKETKRILSLVQQLAKLEKQVGTYYHGIPKLYEEMEWTNSILHGNLNSTTTRTGRLSSTKPNQQNMDHKIRQCIVSRF